GASWGGGPWSRWASRMKRRRRCPVPVIFMVRSQEPRDGGPDPRGADADGERDANVSQREELLAVTQEGERLVAEGGHGREPAAYARGEQNADVVADQPALERQGHHDADDEAPEDVHGERPRREARAGQTLPAPDAPLPHD